MVCIVSDVAHFIIHFLVGCTAGASRRMSALEASMAFRPKKKMRTLNWKKLPRNTAHNNKSSLWKECLDLPDSPLVDVEKIVDLFCRPEIVKKKKEEKSKGPSVVSVMMCACIWSVMYVITFRFVC